MNTGLLWTEIILSLGLSFLLNWGGCAFTARIVKKPIAKGRFFFYCCLTNFVIMIIWCVIITGIIYLLTGELSITGSSFNFIALFLWTAVGCAISRNTLKKRGLLIDGDYQATNELDEAKNKATDEKKKSEYILCEMSLGDHYSYSSDYAWLIHLKEQTQTIKTSDGTQIYDALIKMASDEKGYVYAKQIIKKYDGYGGKIDIKEYNEGFIDFVNKCWNSYNNEETESTSLTHNEKKEEKVVSKDIPPRKTQNNNMNAFMFCRKCGAKMPKDSAFCASCGEKFIFVTDKCPYCGSKLLEGAKFCNKCGKGVI